MRIKPWLPTFVHWKLLGTVLQNRPAKQPTARHADLACLNCLPWTVVFDLRLCRSFQFLWELSQSVMLPFWHRGVPHPNKLKAKRLSIRMGSLWFQLSWYHYSVVNFLKFFAVSAAQCSLPMIICFQYCKSHWDQQQLVLTPKATVEMLLCLCSFASFCPFTKRWGVSHAATVWYYSFSSWSFFIWHHCSGLRAPMQWHVNSSSLVPSVQSFWEAAPYFKRQVKIPVLLTRGSYRPWSFSVTRVAGVFYNGLMTARTSSWFEASSHRSFQSSYKVQYGPSYLNRKAPFQNLLRLVAVWLYFCRGNSGSFHTLSDFLHSQHLSQISQL